VGKAGKGHLITNREGATDKVEFFNIQPIMHGNPGVGEGGISDLEFHPDFGVSGSESANTVFISYWWSPTNSGTFSDDNGIDGYNRLSRFEVVGDAVDLSPELVLINQYDREFWHIGMDLEFGPDGYLYISVGDETPTDCCDLRDTTQRLDGGLWSGILRIDIDNDPTRSHPIRRQPAHPGADPTSNGSQWPQSFTQGYSIPNDNPFLAPDGSGLEEFYSLGLRHPWNMSFDSATGDLWVTDVGHHHREELNLVEKGDNHQWPFRQGTLAGLVAEPAQPIGISKAPTFEYTHDLGRAVIGAGVYRGSRYPSLFGKYIFSDFTAGRLWTAMLGSSGYEAEQIGDVSSGWGNGVVSYLLDSNGQILMAKTAGGQKPSTIQTLVNGAEDVSGQAPGFLSQTGAFADLESLTPAGGCLAYSLNVPFWSDGAEKARWICVPNDGDHNSADEQIEFSADSIWRFPVGTVFIKQFDMAAVEGDPNSMFRLETRFLIHGEDGYYGLTYRWDENGEDAVLVGANGDTRAFAQQSDEGGVQQRMVSYPSRNECLDCHFEVAGGPVGANTRQLNKRHLYTSTGIESNQLETFNHLGMLSPAINVSEAISSFVTSSPIDNTDISLEKRARSYLDANCGYCHRPGGVRAQFDARLTTPFVDQGLVNGPLHETYGIEGEAVLVPGSTEQSIVFNRANRLDNLAMPPLAKGVVDSEGIALLSAWIQSIGPNSNVDSDADGVPDNLDAFSDDPLESVDSDGDGMGDNVDPFPQDATNGNMAAAQSAIDPSGLPDRPSAFGGSGVLDGLFIALLALFSGYLRHASRNQRRCSL